ncbi:hypothetical protein BCR42DRAFT_449342 [Absidia repens]|uniref:RING-CH-type domain-containing protein n=1 Tax=Absidia repens TaxID=90262 RepID=A0A1X2INP6_9FUNG|nr:hypothetical protein BCR42DRAFT_449342 [Absidia repens]
MAHFRCPTSSIVGSTGRNPYTSGDTIQYNHSTPTHIHFDQDATDSTSQMGDTNNDYSSSGDEDSVSSSSSSTILASRTANRSATGTNASQKRRSSATVAASSAVTTSSHHQEPSSSRSAYQGTNSPRKTSVAKTEHSHETIDQEDHRCWICYGEDSDSEGKWVSPCPCSLVAHEKCLLDWINENQKGSPRKTVHCPQCASAYHLVEAPSWILSLLGVVDEATHTIAPYITSLGLGLSLLVVTTTYGAFSVLLLFGSQEGERILGSPSFWTWRTWVGLPSIPLALLSTRSRWADSTLPFAAFLFLRVSASSPSSSFTSFFLPSSSASSPALPATPASSTSPFSLPHIQLSWPPSPLATLGILPWARLFYNTVYYAAQSLIFRQLSLKTAHQQQQQQLQQQNQRRRQRSNSNRLVLVDDQTVNRISDDHNIDPTTTTMTAIEQQGPERSTELDILLGRGPSSVGMLFMGTLLWPVIGNLAGNCLGQVNWIREKLPEPFHRNILGGCLFVVIKDAGNLLYRYQKVRQYRSRRIQNYKEIKHNS